jgi:peptide/nickel transport system substrate-binding protein
MVDSRLGRRAMLGQVLLAGAAQLGMQHPRAAGAETRDRLTISFPVDVPSWDAVAHSYPPAMPIYRSVFDSPLALSPELEIVPSVVTEWRYASADRLALEVTLRDDVLWHNGETLTADDFKFTFDDRPKDEHHMAIADVWNETLTGIDVLTPTRAVMRLSRPMPTAVPWLAFFASYLMPRRYFAAIRGKAGFMRAPIGSGPYRLASYERGRRIVLEAFDRYWAGRARIARVAFEIARDPAARVAAIESGAADIAAELPLREVARLAARPGLVGRLDPTTELILLQVPNAGPLADRNVRLAAHHAIDKQALSRDFFLERAVPLSVPATRGTPGDVPDFVFRTSAERAHALLAQSGFGPDNPVRFPLLTTRGAFANDHEIALAIAAMWAPVGIAAEIQVVSFADYVELAHTNRLPGPCLFSWVNPTGDPEFYAGYLLNPESRLAAWRSDELRAQFTALAALPDLAQRHEAYRALGRAMVEDGTTIPLLQGVAGTVHTQALNFRPWQNGWILPYFQAWA